MTTPDPAPAPRDSGRVPRVRELLAEDLVLLDVSAEDMSDVCEQMVDHLSDRAAISPEAAPRLLEELLARERAAPTAIGLRAMCPHAFLDGLEQPIVLFARLSKPLDVETPDGVKADLVFMLIGPRDDPGIHLESLMLLSRLLQDGEFQRAVHLASTPAEVVEAADAAERRLRPRSEPGAALARAGIEAPTGRFAGGVLGDIRRRLPHYPDDLRQGLNLQSLAATLFLFFACLTAAITFGSVMQVETDGAIGAVEMLMATAVCGVAYALFAGQPLIILGGTGPLLVFTVILFQLSARLELDFLPLYAWVGLWAAAFTVLLALFDASVWMRYLTRFTDEVFVLLISVIYISEALRLTGKEFQEDANYASAISTVVLAAGTFGIAMLLRGIRRSTLLREWARNFLADFGTVIAIAVMCGVAYLMRSETSLPHISVPQSVSLDLGERLAPLTGVPVWAIGLAAVPGAFAAILIYLDQQITARVVNSPHFHLRKGPGYHLDLLLVGLLTGLCSLLGWPWLVAATVRSLNHVNALSRSRTVDTPSGPTVVSAGVKENRLTGVGIHLLIGGSVFLVPLLALVPMACLYGIFLYMGIASLTGNQFAERVTLWVRDPDRYPAMHFLRTVPRRVVHGYTAIQTACLALLWVVKASVLAVLFPLVLALLVPVRLLLLPRLFEERHLAALDAEEVPEDGADREVE